MFELKGKSALVTGAAGGLGQEIAIALARAGAQVAISDKSVEKLEATEAAITALGQKAICLCMDVCNLDQVRQAAVDAARQLGSIDILVNNAGINRPSPGLEVTPELWQEHFDTNVRGGFFLAQAVAPGMIQRKWGRIIFISSQSGLIGIPGQPVYCATKGAVIQLVRTLGLEWAKCGITVNSVAPTFVETNMTRQRLQNPEFRQFVLGKIPCGQLAERADIAAAVVYLASDEARMVNCETHRVDGGWTAW